MNDNHQAYPFIESAKRLRQYVEREAFRGVDPYDVLNSYIDFSLLGRWAPVIATQIQVRNPINIRSLIGIEAGYNPKGMGLFLKAYCNFYRITGDAYYLEEARLLFEWLIRNYSTGYSGMAWGYNFPWAGVAEYKKAFLPSVVVTAAVVEGMYAYYLLTESDRAREAITAAGEYVAKDIPITTFDQGISFAYTHQSKRACYNASLHAAEILLKAALVQNKEPDTLVKQAVRFVLSKQKDNGVWFYSYDPETKKERRQIDFHQGFILVSLHNIRREGGLMVEEIHRAIKRGLSYYRQEQFFSDGRSLWRVPVQWPIDIHNQTQGIITFALLRGHERENLDFVKTIARWTINNMQNKGGFFYYRKYPGFTNKISYMRWSQAWMLLALTELIMAMED